MNVIGLDLSLNGPGFCSHPARAGSLRLDARDGDMRLCMIREAVLHHATAQGVASLAVIESVPPYNTSTASLERVHGVAREALASLGVPFAYVSPTALKLFATGRGGADKAEMIAAVRRHIWDDGSWVPADDNQADAWHLQRMGRMVLAPATWEDAEPHEIAAMSSTAWPLGTGSSGAPVRPYGDLRRKPVVRKCGHRIMALRNGDQWLHPFNVAVCDRPPK